MWLNLLHLVGNIYKGIIFGVAAHEYNPVQLPFQLKGSGKNAAQLPIFAEPPQPQVYTSP